MTSKTITDRSKPADAEDKIGRLYGRAVHWLYECEEPIRARRYTRTLKKLVDVSDPQGEGAFTQECLSLAAEAEGDLAQAIRHREHEIRLIRHLHELARGQDAAHADFIFGQYNYVDLRDRLNILAGLYDESGNVGFALRTLLESKRLCEQHGIEFGEEEALRSCLKEYAAAREKAGGGVNRVRWLLDPGTFLNWLGQPTTAGSNTATLPSLVAPSPVARFLP